MSSGRACVRTAIVVSSGTSSSSMRSAREVEVRLRGRREPDLDLADVERDEEVEEPALAHRVHRVDERLIPVAEIRGAPDRRTVEHAVGPPAIGEIDGRVRPVLPVRHGHRDSAPSRSGRGRTTGAGRLVYVDASLPLAGKEGEQEGQAAQRRHEDGLAHARTILDSQRPRLTTRDRAPSLWARCRAHARSSSSSALPRASLRASRRSAPASAG